MTIHTPRMIRDRKRHLFLREKIREYVRDRKLDENRRPDSPRAA